MPKNGISRLIAKTEFKEFHFFIDLKKKKKWTPWGPRGPGGPISIAQAP